MGGEFTRCALQQFLKDILQTKDTPFPPGVCVYICIDLWVVLLKLTLFEGDAEASPFVTAL